MQLFGLVFSLFFLQIHGEFNFTNETELELTTPFYLNMNSSNETLDDIDLSSPVKRVLRSIFRTYEPYCWRRSYGRGIGHAISACPDHSPEQDGLLCYPPCGPGYNGVGPVCWQKCDNITSLGFACIDVQKSVGSCPWYDKCGILKRSCSICPDNYTNLGCLCGRFYLRHSYGRGVGSALICSKEYEQDGALCYEPCRKFYNGVGPVCWQECPSTQPYRCFAGCSATKQECHLALVNMIQSVVGASVTLLNVIVGVPFVDLTTFDILANAAKGDWFSVAKLMSTLAKNLADKLLPDLAKKFFNWTSGTVESATRNASVLITATAFKDHKSLLPFLKLFRLESINAAFNRGTCELRDDFDEFLNS